MGFPRKMTFLMEGPILLSDRRFITLKKKDYAIAALFLLPAVLLLAVFVIYPIINNVILSFQSWNGIYGAAKQFVGLDNYKAIFSNKAFGKSMTNVGIFLIVGFFIQMPISYGLALLVTSKIRGRKFFRTVYYLPVILGTTIVAVMWKNLLNPNYGAFMMIFKALGLNSLNFDWLNTAGLNVWIVALVNCWKSAPYNMLIFCAGLVTIPESLNEAALIDGCTTWQRIRYITVPLSKNSFKVYSILCITGCIKTFDIVWAMTNGGPNALSSTPAILLYLNAYSFKLMGRSAAIAIILLVLGVTLSIGCNKFLKQEEY